MIQSAERELQNTTASITALLAAFVAAQRGVAPQDQIYEYLKLGAARELNVDGSSENQVFEYEVPAARTARIDRINFAAVVTQVEQVDGFLCVGALPFGLIIEIVNPGGTVVQDFETNAAPIRRHADLSALAGIDVRTESVAAGVKFRFQARWTLARSGAPARLPGGSKIQITIRDNVDDAGIVTFRAMVQGIFIG